MKMAKNSICKRLIVIDRESVIFTFADDTKIEVFAKQFNDKIKAYLICCGIRQVLGDAFAEAKGSVSAAIVLFNTKYRALQAGQMYVAAGGGILSEALAMASGQSLSDAIDAVNKLDDDAKAELKDKLAVWIKKIELQRTIEKAESKPKADDEAEFDPLSYFTGDDE
jgi:hypothetical protein